MKLKSIEKRWELTTDQTLSEAQNTIDDLLRYIAAYELCIQEVRYGHDRVGHYEFCSKALKELDKTLEKLELV